MKVLFLDIDGVVNSIKTTNMRDSIYPLDQYMAFLVGRIVLATDCKVVLSSSWRNHPDGIKEVEKHIVPIHDKTPWASTRGEEIQQWLDEHKGEWERYAILDDDADMLPSQLPHFFKTTFAYGLTDEIANEVINYLNK